MVYDNNPSPEDALAHFGVKGMKWGVVNQDKPAGSSSSASADPPKSKAKGGADSLSPRDKQVLKAAGVSTKDAGIMQAKYGEGSLGPEEKRGLSPGQKKALVGIAAGVGVAAAAYYLHGQQQKNPYFFKDLVDFDGSAKQQRNNERWLNEMRAKKPKDNHSQEFKNAWAAYEKRSMARSNGLNDELIAKMGTERVELSAGSILKRISTEREESIRPNGFYASHDDQDVNRYKAMLPVYWKQWGKSNTEGYIVNIKAAAKVKAPSERETYDLFKSMLDDKVRVPNAYGAVRELSFRDLIYKDRTYGTDEFARRAYAMFAQGWVNDGTPANQHFFGRLQEMGYNALIDVNDAGTLSKRPLRTLSSDLFEIVGHDLLTEGAIKAAQDSLTELLHSMLLQLGAAYSSTMGLGGEMASDVDVEAHLAHFGVKGMRWGQRKAQESGSGAVSKKAARTPEEQARITARNKKIVKVAAVSTVVVGAAAAAYLLKKHGNTKMSALVGTAKDKLVESATKKAEDSLVDAVTNRVAPQQSPAQMMMRAGLMGQKQAMLRTGNQRLTQETWENSARVNRTNKKNAQDSQMTLDQIRNNLNDPNYVWQL